MFNTTRPARGRDVSLRQQVLSDIGGFNPRARGGATNTLHFWGNVVSSFNPRARAGRDKNF